MRQRQIVGTIGVVLLLAFVMSVMAAQLAPASLGADRALEAP